MEGIFIGVAIYVIFRLGFLLGRDSCNNTDTIKGIYLEPRGSYDTNPFQPEKPKGPPK